MSDKNPTRSAAGDLRMAQRAIVLQVLRDDHPEPWTRAELERQLPDFLPEEVEAAIEDLAAEGVLEVRDDETIRASLCARSLDALGLVSI